MKVDSMSFFTVSDIFFSVGSWSMVSMEPPRSSSQLGPHGMVSMCWPVTCDTARATGNDLESRGAVSSLSYS